MTTPLEAVATYILAKDGNRPLLMKHAFTADSELEMIVKTDAISFPSSAKGLDAIQDVLVSRFAASFENIFTFCLSQPAPDHHAHFPCHWLVGMSARDDGVVRVGCGRYDWYFDLAQAGRVRKLIINIEVMNTFPKSDLDVIMTWLSALPYPWCTPEQAARDIPALSGLAVIESYLKMAGSASHLHADDQRGHL